MGSSVTIPYENGKLLLGTWQGIYLCEFDGARERTVIIKILWKINLHEWHKWFAFDLEKKLCDVLIIELSQKLEDNTDKFFIRQFFFFDQL